MRRARMTIAYKGSEFHGFATNPGVETVASSLEGALAQILQQPVQVIPAGRTDAGVHAWGQVISCDLPDRVNLEVLIKQLNALCGQSIVVREAQWTDPDFHARYSALWRKYRYTVLNTPVGNPFMTETSWHITKRLKLRSMQLASDAIIGNHDFSAFCRKPKPTDELDTFEHSMRRTVSIAAWKEMGDGVLRFEIQANAFCHQMVRALVGTFVEIGLSKRPPSDMRGLVISGDRSQAAPVAPAQGLCLYEVGFPDLGL